MGRICVVMRLLRVSLHGIIFKIRVNGGQILCIALLRRIENRRYRAKTTSSSNIWWGIKIKSAFSDREAPFTSSVRRERRRPIVMLS